MKQSQGNKSNNNTASSYLTRRFYEGSFILMLTVAIFMLLSLVTYHLQDPGWLRMGERGHGIANAGGQVGAYIADALYLSFGYLSYMVPLCFTYASWMFLKDQQVLQSTHKGMLLLRSSGLLFVLIGGCGLLTIQFYGVYLEINRPGGLLGYAVAQILGQAFNIQGATLLLSAILLVGVTWLTGLSWVRVTELIGHATLRGLSAIKWLIHKGYHILLRSIRWSKSSVLLQKTPTIRKLASSRAPVLSKNQKEKSTMNLSFETVKPKLKPIKQAVTAEVTKTEGMPSLNLLDTTDLGKPMSGYSHEALEDLSREVEQHLLDFGIQADVVAVHPGPVITRFELQLAAGVKVSKLTALAKDLARSLSVVSVRVVEIIPGKTVVGIELPNPNRAVVSLSSVLSTDVYQKANSPLTLALGVDIAGHPMVVDLAKMPHLLVAGTTGSGKSVGVNAMILSLLFRLTPEQVRLIMVDPKMLELSVYDGIPHLLTPVVTDMKEAASALRWCVAEMERRYRLMAAFGVRNLAGFNTKLEEAQARGEVLTDPLWKPGQSMDNAAPALQALPYVVVIIDELADMMMVVGKKVEQLIARIAQKARAAGIHLILATQRPSVDVLTGLIKSNIPTRISFQVSSKIDSRTILDQQGAEQLLGHGDMLFLAPGTGAPLRVHGAFVDDMEVHRIADDWRARGTPEYIEEITQIGDSLESGSLEESEDTEDLDPLYDQAVEFVIQTRKSSISAVQRRFKVGYNRAARLVEEMERCGVVGPLESGFRDVLVASVTEE